MVVFGVCAVLIFYTHLGYPLARRALVALKRKPALARPAAWDERASASGAMKAWLALPGGLPALARRGARTAPRPALWSKI